MTEEQPTWGAAAGKTWGEIAGARGGAQYREQIARELGEAIGAEICERHLEEIISGDSPTYTQEIGAKLDAQQAEIETLKARVLELEQCPSCPHLPDV